ncbi:MAG: hypothetical protein RIS45_1588 [Planctomycetota bacterium]
MKPRGIEPHVRTIRERYAAGGVTMAELAAELGCSRQAVDAALSGATYIDDDLYGPPCAKKPEPGTEPLYCECGKCGASYTRHVVPGQKLRFRFGVCAACALVRWNRERPGRDGRVLH